jgi:hypothetical protein
MIHSDKCPLCLSTLLLMHPADSQTPGCFLQLPSFSYLLGVCVCPSLSLKTP